MRVTAVEGEGRRQGKWKEQRRGTAEDEYINEERFFCLVEQLKNRCTTRIFFEGIKGVRIWRVKVTKDTRTTSVSIVSAQGGLQKLSAKSVNFLIFR